MPTRRERLVALAVAALALAAFFLLPLLAAQVTRGAIAAAGASDRAAYAAGASPWSWRFRGPDDIVAGKAFGDATAAAAADGLRITAHGTGHGEVGFPLTRQADLARLDLLRVDASTAQGAFSVAVRTELTAPLLRADVPTLAAPVHLGKLHWHDASGAAVPAPSRAAMLRLAFTLPPGAGFTLRGAGLARAGGPMPDTGKPIPSGLAAEGLLRWRDRQRLLDPLATFGNAAPPAPGSPTWVDWVPVAVYAGLLVGGMAAARRQRDERSPSGDLTNAALVVGGPVWFIAGLGLGPNANPAAIAMFAGGIAYAVFLTWVRALPRWHWRGGWRMAGWPLLAVPVAIGVAAVAGHAPAWPSAARALLYIGWAFFQQWLMLAVVAGLLARALPRPAAVLLTALAFALLHTPNGLLMQLCFVAELGWAWWYLHQRALLPVAVAHAGAAVILQACVAGAVLRSLEVSARFLS
ncbi:CPBP family glutamic-type intramembrane protease [Luteibacter yeojuensis]|uniref:CAAX prenyl protease 2/Lysostaphin resistance protein A-like domain-containing protein n=1 Tax=Luteibacter yeojuensis TaxID=345309 RepID=A0A0F3KY57_9GAMM|nr:CPBP family glutamic-type intramembrane protease [Luteibacter yeojuensis]KJV36200.1 hypothetical protein VI08_05845 [Luteibacter yeojuensis]